MKTKVKFDADVKARLLTASNYTGRLCRSVIVFLSLLLAANQTIAQGNDHVNVLRITLVRGISSDETVIAFRSDATAGFDYNADAWKIFNGTFDLSSILADGSKVAINSLPLPDSQVNVKLAVDVADADNYALEFSEYESFSDSTSIVLSDRFTNQQFDIRRGGSYPFTVTADSNSYGNNRFEILFSIRRSDNQASEPIPPTDGSDTRSFSVYPNPVTDDVFVEIENGIGSGNDVMLYNCLGELVTTIELQHDFAMKSGQFDMRNCPPGLYIVRFQLGEKTINERIVKN